MPRLGLDGVRPGERIVVVAMLDVGLGEDAHSTELSGLTRAVAGGEHDEWREQSSAAAKRWTAVDVHDDQDDGGVSIAIERAVRDERRAIARRQRGGRKRGIAGGQ